MFHMCPEPAAGRVLFLSGMRLLKRLGLALGAAQGALSARAANKSRVRWPLVTATQGFSTRAIHAGQDPDSAVGSVVPPIYATSTYIQDKVGEARGGFEYSRSSNPTRTALEECMAALEGGKHGLAFASGLAAEDTLLRTIASPGSHFVVPDDAYGGTYRLFARVHQRWGVAADPAHLTNLDSVAAAITPGETKALWIETPTNPLLAIADIAAIVDLAHAAGALVVVDNTFATPYLQQPLELGADVVVHSTTKYCGGHSDIIGGALVVNDDDLADQLRFHQNAIGGVASPFDCWLVLRGLRTLAVRMERHCDNAEVVAAFLEEHPRIAQVYFPGLDAHPGQDLAKRQMRRYGGMVSFRVVGGEQAALQVCEGTSVIILGESLGGVESLIEHPHTMTHASVAGTQLEVPGDLIRLSVGIEDAEDLVADLDKALA
jgi:cystathionine gamma-synthase